MIYAKRKNEEPAQIHYREMTVDVARGNPIEAMM
jgi:hypothetical protein